MGLSENLCTLALAPRLREAAVRKETRRLVAGMSQELTEAGYPALAAPFAPRTRDNVPPPWPPALRSREINEGSGVQAGQP